MALIKDQHYIDLYFNEDEQASIDKIVEEYKSGGYVIVEDDSSPIGGFDLFIQLHASRTILKQQ